MLRITDSNKTKVVNVPYELAHQIGVFKDMVDVVPDASDGNDEPVFPSRVAFRAHYQVVLDEKTETFDTFIHWVFHSLHFKVTKSG